MTRLLGTLALSLVTLWLVAHLLYIGPVQALAEVTLLWLLAMAGASVAVAAIVLLVVGLALSGSRPAWFRFVRAARAGAAVLGAAVVLVGLLHYRDTAPRGGEVHWIALGLAVLAGAGIVHWWVVRTDRRARR